MTSLAPEASTTSSTASSESRPTNESPSSTSNPPVTSTENEITHTIPPLTSYWTTPWSCTWTFNEAEEPQPGATGAVAWLDLEPVHGASTLSCYPDSMFYGGRTGVFSPASCPHGWLTVSVYVSAEEVLDGATTTAVCCSSEYSLDGQWCKRSVPTVLAIPITYNETDGTHEVFSSSMTTLYSATIAVHTIQALFREEDRALLGLLDHHSGDNPGLSTDAMIGVGVGATVGGLLLIGLLIFAFMRYRRRRRQTPGAARRPKGASMHELNAMGVASRHRTPGGHAAPGDGHSIACYSPSVTHGIDTASAYEISRERNSMTDDEGDPMDREDEIKALREEKAAIDRRIEELQRVETNKSSSEN